MRIEHKDILGYIVKYAEDEKKVEKEVEKEVCPDCFADYNVTPNKDSIITEDDLDRSEDLFCDDCGDLIG